MKKPSVSDYLRPGWQEEEEKGDGSEPVICDHCNKRQAIKRLNEKNALCRKCLKAWKLANTKMSVYGS